MLTIQTLSDKLETRKTEETARSVVRDLMLSELQQWVKFGGSQYARYKDFRLAVVESAMGHPVVSSKQLAALHFNNLRHEINAIIEAYGGIEVNGKHYVDVVIERDPAVGPRRTNIRVPEGNWLVVDASRKRVHEACLSKEVAGLVSRHFEGSRVISREEYLTEVL